MIGGMAVHESFVIGFFLGLGNNNFRNTLDYKYNNNNPNNGI